MTVSIGNHALNVNSQDPVNIEPTQILPYNLKLFVYNSRKVCAALAFILHLKHRANDKVRENAVSPPEPRDG
jgi:hypothetical protein